MLQIKQEINEFYDLKEMCWSGAIYTLEEIERNDKEDELMQHLDEVFAYDEELPTITSINDYLWFEDKYIFESLGIRTKDEIQEDIDEVEAEIADLQDEIENFQIDDESDEEELEKMQEQLEELQEKLEELKEELGE